MIVSSFECTVCLSTELNPDISVFSSPPPQRAVLSKGEPRKDGCMKTELLKDITNNKEEGEHLPWLRVRAGWRGGH